MPVLILLFSTNMQYPGSAHCKHFAGTAVLPAGHEASITASLEMLWLHNSESNFECSERLSAFANQVSQLATLQAVSCSIHCQALKTAS